MSKIGVLHVFRPLVGHFNVGSKIIFGGCNLYQSAECEGEDKTRCINTAEKIAENFGLSLGSIYLNEKSSMPHVEPYVGEYFWNADKKIYHLACQLLFDIPVFEQFVKSAIIGNNKGYTVKISPDSTQVFKDDLYNALENKKPSGDLVVDKQKLLK